MSHSHSPATKTILIVDDDVGVSECLEHVLVSQGYHVLSGSSLHQLQQLDPRSVDLLLLDVSVTDRNGWEPYVDFTTSITPIPIVILNGSTEHPAELLPPNVRASLDKPFDPPSLFAVLRYVFGPKRGTTTRSAPPSHTAPPDPFEALQVRWEPIHQWNLSFGGA